MGSTISACGLSSQCSCKASRGRSWSGPPECATSCPACAAGFALCMPIFVGRLGQSHVTLSTQGLLILSIALCVYVFRQRPTLAFAFQRRGAGLDALAVHPLLGLQVLYVRPAGRGACARLRQPTLGRGARLACAGHRAAVGVGDIFAGQFRQFLGVGQFGFSPWRCSWASRMRCVRSIRCQAPNKMPGWAGDGVLLLAMAIFRGQGQGFATHRWLGRFWPWPFWPSPRGCGTAWGSSTCRRCCRTSSSTCTPCTAPRFGWLGRRHLPFPSALGAHRQRMASSPRCPSAVFGAGPALVSITPTGHTSIDRPGCRFLA